MLESLFIKAWEKRKGYHDDQSTSVYRIFHGYADGVPGINIDRYEDILICEYEEFSDALVQALFSTFEQIDPTLKILLKAHRKLGLPLDERFTSLHENMPLQICVREFGILYQINLFAAHSCGLYLDAKPARKWLQNNCSDHAVLNLFAYSGSLGLSAIRGGASSVLQIDKSAQARELCEINFTLNKWSFDSRDYVVGDLYKHLPRLVRKSENQNTSFDGIIIDPPPKVHKTRAMQHRPMGQDFDYLVAETSKILNRNGWLMCLFHRFGKPREEFEAQVIASSAVPLKIQRRGFCGEDFAEANPDNRLKWTVFVRD